MSIISTFVNIFIILICGGALIGAYGVLKDGQYRADKLDALLCAGLCTAILGSIIDLII